MKPRPLVRLYDPARDAQGLRTCIADQQDFHRGLETSWPEGQAIVDDYLTYLTNQCAIHDGRVLVAEADGDIVGFVCVVASTQGQSPDDPAPFAWIHDVFVKAAWRGQGVATRLMAAAESFARGRGAKVLRLGVLARNAGAQAFYGGQGFREYVRVLTKSLT